MNFKKRTVFYFELIVCLFLLVILEAQTRTVREKQKGVNPANIELLRGSASTQNNLFNEVYRDGDVKRYSEVHDDGYYTALCWVEIITLTEYKNGTNNVNKEYAILFESPGDVPNEYLEKLRYNDEVVPYEVIEDDTKKSHILNFTRVDVSREATVLENRKMLCASGPVYTKELIEWPRSTKKRVEFKVSPKKKDVLVVKPVRSQKPIVDEPTKITLATDASERNSESLEYGTRIPPNLVKADSIIQQQVVRPQSVTYNNPPEVKINENEKKKKKKQAIVTSESELSKRVSMYQSVVRNELDDREPVTSKYILKTSTMRNKPGSVKRAANRNLTASNNEMELQPSFSNSIITFSPHAANTAAVPQNTKQDFHSLCAKDKQHVLVLKINIVMEHKITSLEGERFVFPALGMEKQVEFDVHPNSINKTESVTSLLLNEKWEKFLIDLANGKGTNYEKNNARYSSHYTRGNRFPNSVTIDEATKYVSKLQNSLDTCVKDAAKRDEANRKRSEKQASVKRQKPTSPPRKHKTSISNEEYNQFPSEAHAINYYLNQPIVKESASTKRSVAKTQNSVEAPNPKNRSMIFTDVKRNHSSEEYIIEEMIDQQPSDTSSKHTIPGKHIRTFKRIVIHGDDPENAQVEEYSEVNDDNEETVVSRVNDITTPPPLLVDTAKFVPHVLIPQDTTETKVVPVVNDSDVREGNIFVKVLGTLSSILRRLAA